MRNVVTAFFYTQLGRFVFGRQMHCLFSVLLACASSLVSSQPQVVHLRGRTLLIPEPLASSFRPYLSVTGYETYLDRNADRVEHIMDWMRDGSLPVSQPDLLRLEAEADFFGLSHLKEAVGERLMTTTRFIHFLSGVFPENVTTQTCGIIPLYHFLSLTANAYPKSSGCRAIYAVDGAGRVVSVDGHAYILTPEIDWNGNPTGTILGNFQPELSTTASRWTCLPHSGDNPVFRFYDQGHSPPSSVEIPFGNSVWFSLATAFCRSQGGIQNNDFVQALVYDSFLEIGSHPFSTEMNCQTEMQRLGVLTLAERLETIGRLVFLSIHNQPAV